MNILYTTLSVLSKANVCAYVGLCLRGTGATEKTLKKYFSVVRKCFGRYLLVPLLFLRERNGARRRIDDRLEKYKG